MKWNGSIYNNVKRWISAKISRKLTLSVVLVCFFLIGLIWLLGVKLLEPAYDATIRNELSKTLDTFTYVLDKASAEGVPILVEYETEAGSVRALSSQVITLLNEEISNGSLDVENLCIDVGDGSYTNVFLWDQLPSKCVLHKTGGLLGEIIGRNGSMVTELRQLVMEGNTVYQRTEMQMIMGKPAADGSVSVIISANLERIPQAVKVLERLMFFVSITLLTITTLAAIVFGQWFTKPLAQLSEASKEIAKGNYEISVIVDGEDEIADLSRDFNNMAKEVKLSADLQKDLIANVSHDLRTPLTLIKGYAETVRDLTGDDPVKRERQLNVIVDETDRLSALVGSVMELSRMSSGHEKLNIIEFNLTQLCDETAYRYQEICHQKGYNFVFVGNESCMVKADPALIERALYNLLGNAMNHVGDDGYIGFTIGKTSTGMARVEVIDHGPGILKEDMPRLFDRYYRSRADAGKTGTGLGLSITKEIFTSHGFAYGIESEPGKGATFWFEAPLYEPGERTPQ